MYLINCVLVPFSRFTFYVRFIDKISMRPDVTLTCIQDWARVVDISRHNRRPVYNLRHPINTLMDTIFTLATNFIFICPCSTFQAIYFATIILLMHTFCPEQNCSIQKYTRNSIYKYINDKNNMSRSLISDTAVSVYHFIMSGQIL